jgi:phage repressor protein C with HTH and peptisase S24 domain
MRHICRMTDGNDGEVFYRRVLALGKRKGMNSAQAICKAAGVNKDFLRKIKDGENSSPDVNKIRKIALAIGATVESLATDNSPHAFSDDSIVASGYMIDELDVRPSAGDGALPESTGEIITGKWSLPEPLVRMQTSSPAAALKVLSVSGDSMVPDFLPGERVLVDTSHKVPSPSGPYILWDGFGLVLKRLEIIPNSEPPAVRLIPRNTQYATYERPLADVTIHARVIGKWTWT